MSSARLLLALPVAFLLLACGGGGGGSASSGGTTTPPPPPPTDYWAKHLGGAQDDGGFLSMPFSGGVLLVGTTRSFGAGGSDAWVLKADATGAIQAQVALGGSFDDALYDARPTSDGGFILAGTTASFGAGAATPQAWLVKLNADLTVAWEYRYVPEAPATSARFATVVPVGNQFLALGALTAGDTDTALFTVIGSDGTLQTQQAWSGKLGTRFISAAEAPDHGLFLGGEAMVTDFLPVGVTTPYAASWYARLAPDLQTLNFSRYFVASYTSNLTVVRATSDGGAVMAGSWTGYGFTDCWVAKLNPTTGFLDWQTGIGGGSGWNLALDLLETPDHHLLLTASTTATFSAGGTDLWRIKLDGTGAVLWQKTYGTAGGEGLGGAASWIDPGTQSIFSVSGVQTANAGQDLWLLKTKADGTCPPYEKTSNGVVYSATKAPLNFTPTVTDLHGQFVATASTRTVTTAQLQ